MNLAVATSPGAALVISARKDQLHMACQAGARRVESERKNLGPAGDRGIELISN